GVMLLDNIRLARGVFQAMKPPQAPFASGLPERELLGDFNNDGILDRLLVGPTLALERGNADGTFADATGGSGLPQTARAATWADVDRDGNLDAVLIVGQDYAVRVLLGDGTGRFTDATADWAMPTDAFPAPVVRVYAADDEPDGDVDLHFELADEKWITWRHFSTHGPRDLSFVEVTMEGAHEGHITLNLSDGKGPPAGEARPYGGKSWGARRLIPALGEIPGPDARALYFLPPGQYQLSATLSTGKALTEQILVEDPGQRVCVAPDALFALWPKRQVAIDGKMSPGEWDDAPKIAKTLSYVDYKTKKDESHPMTIWYRGDPYALYLCIKVEGDDFGDSLLADMLNVCLATIADGRTVFRDVRSFWSHIYNDYHFGGVMGFERDPILDGRGAMSHSNPKGVGDYVYELMIPWDSHDPDDIAVKGDATLGIKVIFQETQRRGGMWFWESQWGAGGLPDANATDGSTYATLEVRGLSRSTATRPGPVTVALTPPHPRYAVKGRVLDTHGKPVPGAHVGLVASYYEGTGQRVTTDNDGRYELPASPTASERPLQVFFRAEGFAPLVKDADGSGKELDVALGAGRPLEGLIIGPDEMPLQDADISIYMDKFTGVRIARAKTDTQGRFRIEHLPETSLWLSAYKPESGLGMLPPRPMPAGQAEVTIDFRPPIRAAGQVTDAKTGNPIPRFSLGWWAQRGGDKLDVPFFSSQNFKEFQSPAGQFKFLFGYLSEDKQGTFISQPAQRLPEALPSAPPPADAKIPLKFRLSVMAPGHIAEVLERDFSPGDDVRDLKVTLQPGLELTGEVFNAETGAPLPEASIALRPDEEVPARRFRLPSHGATSDKEGRFRIDTLTEGRYWVAADAVGFAPAVPSALEVRAEAANRLTLALGRGVAVEGQVRGERGWSVGAIVEMRSVQSGLPRAAWSQTWTQAGPEGKFRFPFVAPGTYFICRTLDASGYTRMMPSGRIVLTPSGPRTDEILGLRPPVPQGPKVRVKVGEKGNVSVVIGGDGKGARVFGQASVDGKPAANALVTIEEAKDDAAVIRRWDAVTNTEGSYSIQDV
ncbi:MAG: hypothetical protein FJ279_21435, partial [Planctomycetes bacterium]|nr:hypothetical protein [Planctomycetota bacterium]